MFAYTDRKPRSAHVTVLSALDSALAATAPPAPPPPPPHPGGGVPRGGHLPQWSLLLSFALHAASPLPSAYLLARCAPPCFVFASSCSYHVSHRT
jgi:hypothetical protein